MRAVVMHEPGNVTVEEMPMPSILEPTDAIIKLAATCICGSDLWPYRGAQPVHEQRMSEQSSTWSCRLSKLPKAMQQWTSAAQQR